MITCAGHVAHGDLPAIWMYVDMFGTLQKRPGFSCAMLIVLTLALQKNSRQNTRK